MNTDIGRPINYLKSVKKINTYYVTRSLRIRAKNGSN